MSATGARGRIAERSRLGSAGSTGLAREVVSKHAGWLIGAAWTLGVGLSFAWNVSQIRRLTEDQALVEARSTLQKDIVYRKWATAHGGVYVPVTDQTPPSPFLSHIPERDLTTPSGRRLTLVNPAYMTRQVQELGRDLYGSRGHITSLRPIREENAPDAWERLGLVAFESGTPEVGSLESVGGEAVFRFMRPLVTEAGCLKCHAHQGYEAGDVRGGVSVSVPMAPYRAIERVSVRSALLANGAIWGLGLVGVAVGARLMRNRRRELAEAEHVLRESESRYRSLFENMEQGLAYCRMLFVDGRPDDFVYLAVNDSFEMLTGLANVEGKLVSEVIPGIRDSDPELLERYGRVAATGQPERFEIFLETLGIWFSISAYSPQRDHFVAIFDVVTERKRTEESLRASEERFRLLNAELERRVEERTAQLENTSRELASFSYSVSHDLRTPLRAIDGFSARVLTRYGEQLDDEGRRALSVVRTNAQRMGELIDGLIAFSQIGRSGLLHSRVDMGSLAKSAFLQVAGSPAVGGRVEFTVGSLPDAWGDGPLLRQVWVNLLSNAVKFSAGRERPVIEVEGTVEGESVVYRVRDNGVGFDMQHAGQLFKVFHRLHGSGDFVGQGVGLAIAGRIVDRLGGRAWAEGSVGQGATFSFELPRPPNGNPGAG